MQSVAIVGGGIAGLAAAVALRQRGIESTVYERAPALREVGAGIVLWPNATRVLDELGVLGRVAERAGPAASVAILRTDGRRLAQFSTARDDAPSLCVRRPDLLAALADAAGADAIRLGHTFASAEAGAGGVEVRFECDSVQRADLLIGADGVRSAVRSAQMPEIAPLRRGYTVWRGIGRAPSGWPAADACEVWGRGERFGLFRLDGGDAYWYVCASRPAGQPSVTDLAEVQAIVAGWHPAIGETVTSTPAGGVVRHDIVDLPARGRRTSDRVVLIGDAAHGMTPDLGQGSAQALADARDLAELLMTSDPLPARLDRFARRQRRRSVPVLLQSRFAAWLGQLDGPAAGLRNAATFATPSPLFGAAFTAPF